MICDSADRQRVIETAARLIPKEKMQFKIALSLFRDSIFFMGMFHLRTLSVSRSARGPSVRLLLWLK